MKGFDYVDRVFIVAILVALALVAATNLFII